MFFQLFILTFGNNTLFGNKLIKTFSTITNTRKKKKKLARCFSLVTCFLSRNTHTHFGSFAPINNIESPQIPDNKPRLFQKLFPTRSFRWFTFLEGAKPRALSFPILRARDLPWIILFTNRRLYKTVLKMFYLFCVGDLKAFLVFPSGVETFRRVNLWRPYEAVIRTPNVTRCDSKYFIFKWLGLYCGFFSWIWSFWFRLHLSNKKKVL